MILSVLAHMLGVTICDGVCVGSSAVCFQVNTRDDVD